ncbi:hypothetical protein [Aurantiacibacter sp. D1-12]|uniref:hypothetical protein n=1 Tax=Aurantiacibacter sp. D1-12 TaxID=2993658 RepID=UPI00237CB42D|nr:hypothetical protein [Aurantiacibacter sp. D1-12]MDE1468621.1 hypothetical protein [Aurantiacibacter sp. D1-12]
MKIFAISIFVLFFGSACSKTTTFHLQNETDDNLNGVVITQSGDPQAVGMLRSGETQMVTFQAYFENQYRLTFERAGTRYQKDLCYQAWGHKADGVIVVRPESIEMTCH